MLKGFSFSLYFLDEVNLLNDPKPVVTEKPTSCVAELPQAVIVASIPPSAFILAIAVLLYVFHCCI